MRDRVKARPHPAIVRHVLAKDLPVDAEHSFEPLMHANVAHVVMLARTGIIPEADAGALLRLYLEMLREGPDCLTLDPELEDLHFNVEAHVIRQLGPEVGGRMHTGRSRNDLGAAVTRIRVREAVLHLLDLALALRRVLLDRAEAEAEVVMPGYTHMQPAQPITFGYYMAALADALERDTARLEAVYDRTNRGTLGAGALAGTSFPVDRDLLARLLGFEGLVESNLDAVASRDFVLEMLSALAIMGTTVSRLAHDLYIWATDEFGLIEVADEVAVVSSIMPQKKNPVTLEHCKGKAAHLQAALMDALGATRATPFTNARDVNRESVHPMGEAVAEAEAILELMAATVATLSVRPERMLARAQEDFSTVTELADTLVRSTGLSFRTAHQIVAEVVVDAVAAGRRAVDLDSAAVDRAAERVLGRPLGLEEAAVRAALDARQNVLGRRTVGSPRPDEVRRMAARARATVAAEEARLAERRRRLAAAAAELETAARQLLP